MGGEWITRQLADVVAFENKRRIPLSAAQRSERPGDIPYWGANGPFATVDDHLFDGPRVLVAEDGNTVVRPDGRGTVHWADGKYWVNNHAHVLGVQDNHSLRWLYYALLTAQVGDLVSGSAQPKLSMGSLKRLRLSVPPPPEQRAIASVLCALDDKIESNRRLVGRQREVRTARYRHVVGDADQRQPLQEIAIILTGTVQPSLTPDAMFEQFSIPAFDAGEDPDICAGATMASGKTALPAEPVVLLSKLNPGTPRVWNPIATGRGVPVCSPEFVVLAPAEAVSHAWLETCVRSDGRFYDEVLSTIGGTTGSRQRVKPADVLSATVPVVSTEALHTWTSFAAPLIAREAALDRERRTLTGLRDALLPKLVSGQLRVPLTLDELEAVGTVAAELATGSALGY